MKITWDAKAGAIYIYLRPIGKGGVTKTVEVAGSDSIVIDYDEDGKPVGIDIIGVDEPVIERILGKETKMNYPNPKETENAVRRWHEALQTLDEVHKQIANALPLDLLMKRDEAEAEVATRREICRVAVETHGGYKGEVGECYYQKKEHIEYLVPQFKELYPEFAFCIDEVLNKAKVEGLVKGKLIDPETLERATLRTPLTDAFILR